MRAFFWGLLGVEFEDQGVENLGIDLIFATLDTEGSEDEFVVGDEQLSVCAWRGLDGKDDIFHLTEASLRRGVCRSEWAYLVFALSVGYSSISDHRPIAMLCVRHRDGIDSWIGLCVEVEEVPVSDRILRRGPT